MIKDIKVKLSWQNKTLAEWLKMFPEDTSFDIHSYGVSDSMLPSIKRFNEDVEEEEKNIWISDKRTKDISQAIVKRIFQHPSDHERLIFDVKGTTVHLWNQTLMENKDPNKEMSGLKVPLKAGVDAYDLFTEKMKEWKSEPFYMDDYAKSCLIHNDCLEISHDS